MLEDTFGGLKVRITGGRDRQGDLSATRAEAGPVVVLLHGFGATGEDLVPLWRVLDVPHDVRFVFPEAPLSLASAGYGAGRAWWMLDLEAMERRARGQDKTDRSSELPDGLLSASDSLRALLEDVQARMGVGPERIILGGFSQGSMLCLDCALHAGLPLAGLVLLSTTLIARERWTPALGQLQAVPVLQSHGVADPLLPFDAAEELRDLLRAADVDVRWEAFRGGHELPQSVLSALGEFISARFS